MKDRLSRLWNRPAVWAPWGLVFVFFAWKTSDIWRHLGSRHYALKGALLDTFCTSWLSWWSSLAIWSGEHFRMSSGLTNYPEGAATALSYSLSFVHIGLAGLLRPLVGTPTDLNLVAMLGLGMSLAAIFLVLRAVSGNGYLSAVLAALVLSYGIAGNNCLLDPELICLAYLVFSLLAWKRYTEQGGRWWLVGTGLLVAFTSYAQMYYGTALLATLGTAVVLGLCGVSFPGVSARVLMRRTLLVMAVGFALALLFHARNIVEVVASGALGHMQRDIDIPWHYTLLDGALLLAAVLAPAALGLLLGSQGALVWGLLCLPVAVLSLGFSLDHPLREGALDMPLGWARQHLPLVWRLTFPPRFVGPLLLGVALTYAALWRGLSSSAVCAGGAPGRRSLVAAAVLTVLFWATAAFVPLTPDTTGQSDPYSASVAAGRGDGRFICYLAPVELLAQRGEAARGSVDDPVRSAGRFRTDVLGWPLQPLRTFELPSVPPCIRQVAGEKGDFAILDLTQDHRLKAYSHYYQTIHGKAIAGYPCRFRWMDEQGNEPSMLTRIQYDFEFGNLERLPDPAWLRRMGVRYVAHYGLPEEEGGKALPCVRPDVDPAVARSEKRQLDFEAVYGAPRCSDYVMNLYEIGAGPPEE
jgi:hypothetical protein